MRRFRPALDPARSLKGAGYAPDELGILRDFGADFYGGVYRQYANHFGSHLVRLAQEPASAGPRVSVLRDGMATIVGIAARDYRGLAAVIAGAFWQNKIELRQAHLFSAMNHGLALDFFHISPCEQRHLPKLKQSLADAIQRQLYIAESDEANLPGLTGGLFLRDWRPGQCCLRLETSQDVSGLIYALTHKVYRHLRGNIFGLTAHAAGGKAYISVYLSLPPDLSLEQAQIIVKQHF